MYLPLVNYLGHIYFSANNNELAQANLYGDFVKGSHLAHLPQLLQNGILLHREIDHYVDHHPAVRTLLPHLRPTLPKVAPIAIDLYFDHLLAKNWQHFHKIPLTEFLNDFYQSIQPLNPLYPIVFNQFLENMARYNWMSHYAQTEGLNKMCHGVSRKLSFNNALSDGLKTFLANKKHIESAFYEYMSDANEHFLTFHSRIMS